MDALNELLAVMTQDALIRAFVRITVVGKNARLQVLPKIALIIRMEHGPENQADMLGWQNSMVCVLISRTIFSLP